MAIPIIVAQVKEVLSGTYSSTAFIDTSSSICQSLLQDAVAAANAIQLSDRLDTLMSSGLINLLLDLFKIDLKPINETTVRLKCLALGTMTQLLKGISSGENTSYVRIQTSLLKNFVALGGMDEIAKAMSDPRAGNTQLTDYVVQFLRHFVQVRFGIVCLFRETYASGPLLTTYLYTCTGNPDALNEILGILTLYTTTSFSKDEFLLFLSTRVPDFLFEKILSPSTQPSIPISNSTCLAALNLLSDLLERLHTFKQSVAQVILANDEHLDKAMGQYNALLRHQDRIFARLVMDDYLVANLLGGGCTKLLLSTTGTKYSPSLHLSAEPSRTVTSEKSPLYQPDAITIRLLSLFFLHCGERRIEAYTRVPFSILEGSSVFENRLPLLSVQEEQEIVDYLAVVYSVRLFRSLASFFYSYLDAKSVNLDSRDTAYITGHTEIVGAYLRIMLLFLVYSPSFFKQTLIDAALLEYNALQFEASSTQTMKLSSGSGSSGRRRTLLATFFIPLVQNIITPVTYFPTVPVYAAATFGIFCITIGNTLDYSNFQSLLQVVAEYVAPDSLPLEEVILTKVTNCFMSNSLDFLQDVYIFLDIKFSPPGISPESVSTVPRPISHDIILLNSGYNAMCTALYAARCVYEDPTSNLGRSASFKVKESISGSAAQNQRISRMNANLLALYSSSASLKLFATDKELSLVSARTYLTLLDCLVSLFEVTDKYSHESHYKLMQEYETYVVPNTIYSLYRRQDVLLLLQSINSPNVTLLCRNTREFLITHIVLLLHDIRSTTESLNVSTVTDAISRYIIDLSEALDLELMTSASKGQTDFTSICAIDKLTFCRALLVILCDPYILLANGDVSSYGIFHEIGQYNSALKITIDDTIQQLNSLLAHEILVKSVHSFCNFYTTNRAGTLVDLSHNLLVNVANDIRRLREIDNLKRVHGTQATDTSSLKTAGSFARHFDPMIGNGLVPLEVNFASLMMQLCDRYGSSLVNIASQTASLAGTQKRGTDLLRSALVIARSLDSDLTYANSRSDTSISQSYSILSTSTSLAQVSRLHSNKIKCKLISHMLQADKLADGAEMVFMGKRDTLSYKGFGINTAYCLRYAYNTYEKTAMQQMQLAHTKNPTIFMVSSKFSQIQTLKADFGISLPNFRLQIADLLEITSWILEVIKYDYNVRVPEILYSPDLTETGAMPFSSAFITELFPSYMNNTLELAIQATLKAREDNDRTLRFIDNTKDDSDSILHIIHRKVAIKICESVLESLYKLRLMFFGLLGSKVLFNAETSTFDTDFKRFPEQNGYIGVYTRDTDGEPDVSALPYKGKLAAYYFSETNAEVSRMSSVALVALMLTLMQPRRGAGVLTEASLTGFNSSSPLHQPPQDSEIEKDAEINMEAINLSPLQTIAFTEMLQESLRYGFVMDNNIRYLQVNVKFENIILGNAESNLSINAYIPRVRAFLNKYSNYSFAVPTVTSSEQEVIVRSSLMDDVFATGKLSETYVPTKAKDNIDAHDPDHYRNSSRILKTLFEEKESQSQFSEVSGESQFGRLPEKRSPSLITPCQQVPSRLVSTLLNVPRLESNKPNYNVAEDEFVTRQLHSLNMHESENRDPDECENDAFKLDEIINRDVVLEHGLSIEDPAGPHTPSSRTSETGSTPVPCVAPNDLAEETVIESTKVCSSDKRVHRASSISGPGGIPKSIATIKKRAIPPPPPASKSPSSKRSTFIERISASLAERQVPNTSVTPELSSYKDDFSASSASEGSETPVIIQISKGTHEPGKLEALNKDVSQIEGSFGARTSEGAIHPIEFGSAMSGVDTNTLVALMDSLSLDVKQVIENHHASKDSSPIMKGEYDERFEKEIAPAPCALSSEKLDSIITSLENLPKLGPPPSFT